MLSFRPSRNKATWRVREGLLNATPPPRLSCPRLCLQGLHHRQVSRIRIFLSHLNWLSCLSFRFSCISSSKHPLEHPKWLCFKRIDYMLPNNQHRLSAYLIFPLSLWPCFWSFRLHIMESGQNFLCQFEVPWSFGVFKHSSYFIHWWRLLISLHHFHPHLLEPLHGLRLKAWQALIATLQPLLRLIIYYKADHHDRERPTRFSRLNRYSQSSDVQFHDATSVCALLSRNRLVFVPEHRRSHGRFQPSWQSFVHFVPTQTVPT